MELSPARQKLLFVVIVALLTVLGYYLVVPGMRHTDSTHSAPPATAAPSITQQSSQQQQQPPTSAGTVNIYSWLPFTQADLAVAAQVATRFCADYDTFSYTENADAYLSRMNGLVTAQLAETIRNGYGTPGVAGLIASQQQTSTGTAVITGLRAFGPSSLTFIVAITQKLQSVHGTSAATTPYAVTLTGQGTNWQVNDIEPQQAGNL